MKKPIQKKLNAFRKRIKSTDTLILFSNSKDEESFLDVKKRANGKEQLSKGAPNKLI